jgi:hypothetical protein
VCLCVCVWVCHAPGRAHGPGIGHARPRRRRPVLPHTTVVLTRNSLPEITEIACVTTYSAAYWPKAAKSCRAKRRRPRAVIGRKEHFRRLSHSHFRNGPRRRLDELGRRRSACAPQSPPRVQTTVAPSPLPDLTVLSNTGVWVPPVGTSARRGATPPSGGRVWSCVDHTLAHRPTSDVIGRNT